jgi:hypothetical protein
MNPFRGTGFSKCQQEETMREGKGINRIFFRFTAVMIVLVFLSVAAATAVAAEIGKCKETGKFQVVAGSDDKAYLVDTVSGAVWVLTYRTMATGREPIAIPYKFIRISPKNQGEFLVESAGDNASMPPSSGR